MATRARQSKPSESSLIDRDATEFGVGVRCGGWRLGLLVARSVAPAKAGRPKADENRSLENDLPAKISMNAFAEKAGVSVSHVKYYFDAWALAATAGLVPAADSIAPGDEEVCVDAEAIEVEDDPKTQWSWFYSLAKNPPKPKEKKEDSKAKQEQLNRLSVDDDDDDDDDSVDEDFGMTSFTKDEAAEADSSIQRNNLLEILESLRAVQSRVEQAGAAIGDNADIYSQIASAALDLNVSANAMMVRTEETEKVG